jgi:hypothetical protein
MTIEFECPGCQKQLRVQDAAAGKKAQCPECGALIHVPAEGVPVGVAPAAPAFADAGDNPFQSPAAAGSDFQARSPVPLTEIVPTRIDLGDVFDTAWRLFKDQWGMLVVAMLVVTGVQFVLNMIVSAASIAAGGEDSALIVLFVLNLISYFCSLYLTIGFMKIALDVGRGEPVSLGSLFSGAALVPSVFAAALLVGLMVIGGLLLLIVPGVILGLMFSQFMFLMIERNAGIGESLSLSRKITSGNKTTLFAIYVLASLGGLVFALVTCGIGALVAYPFIMLAYAVAYLKMTGQRI